MLEPYNKHPYCQCPPASKSMSSICYVQPTSCQACLSPACGRLQASAAQEEQLIQAPGDDLESEESSGEYETDSEDDTRQLLKPTFTHARHAHASPQADTRQLCWSALHSRCMHYPVSASHE